MGRALPAVVTADLVLDGFSEVATLAGPPGPRRGPALSEVGRVDRGAIALDRGRFVWVGPSKRLRREVRLRSGGRRLHFPGALAVPGFVDAHTHLLFAGSREGEIGRKVRGESYLSIAASGGGLFRSVRDTRAASPGTLFQESLARLRRMIAWGTTSLEVKSGYGLDVATELRLLRLVPRLSRASGATLVPTFLGGHAFPPEHAKDHARYLRLLVERALPAVAGARLARFCDVFCEEGFFSASESERLLRRGAALGLSPKIHADEFSESGGALVAAKVRAVSADHLLCTSSRGRRALREADVIPVLLPVTPLSSLAGSRSLGREMADEGLPVALGTDLSPNSWVESMPTVLAHAVHSARLTPEEALVASTVNAAYASGLGGQAGEIVPGRRADLAIFDLPSVEHLPYRWGTLPPSAVFLAGRAVRRFPASRASGPS